MKIPNITKTCFYVCFQCTIYSSVITNFVSLYKIFCIFNMYFQSYHNNTVFQSHIYYNISIIIIIQMLLPEQSLVIFHPLTNFEHCRKIICGKQFIECLFIFSEISCAIISLHLRSYVLLCFTIRLKQLTNQFVQNSGYTCIYKQHNTSGAETPPKFGGGG